MTTSMSSRKGSLSPIPGHALGVGGGNSIRSNRGILPPGATRSRMSAEYVEALQVMSGANMRRACELLLSNDRPRSANADGDPNQRAMLHLLAKCQKAAKVLQEQEPKMMPPPIMPSAPSLGGRFGNRGGSVSSSLSKLNKKGTTIKQGMVPMRRSNPNAMMMKNRSSLSVSGTSKMTAAGSKHSMKHLAEHRAKHARHLDDASSVSSTSSSIAASNKKARTMNAVDTATAATASVNQDGTGDGTAPPQNALSFLAKLNKDPTKNAKEPQQQQQQQQQQFIPNSPEDQQSVGQDDAEASESPLDAPPTPKRRKNPSRTGRRNA